MRALSDKEMLLVSGGTSLLNTKTLAAITVVGTYQSGGSLTNLNGVLTGLYGAPISVVGGRTVPLNPLPNNEMTPTEIYNYLLGKGWTPTGALAETITDCLGDAMLAASVGTAIGTGLSDLIQTYDPSLEQAIGGTVAGMIQDINGALQQFSLGHIEQGLGVLFGNSADAAKMSQQNDQIVEDVVLNYL